MKELGVTFHCGSGTDAIRSEKDLKSIDEHNNRKYTNKNNQELNPELSHENVILVGSRYIVEDIKKVYKDEFTEAVYNYNMKQKREDRKILDYYTKINNDKQTNLACEMLFQFGDYDHWKDKTLEERKKMTEVFKGVIDILKDYNIVTAQATIHYDESCPHMHLVGVPISNDNKRGMEKQVSQNKVITLKNLDLIREDVEKMFAREYNRVYNEEVAIKHGSEFEEHLKISQYKKAKEILKVAQKYEYNLKIKDAVEEELENVKEEIKDIEEKITEAKKEKEDKIEKIEDVKTETNNLTSELTKLETSKNTKEKEKDDLEKELDLFQQKIKAYKEKIVKDKEDAIKQEEEQKKIEEDLKEKEKKIKAVNEELEKKNKEYNNHLTEKNNLEEKKKKLDAEKQKIEEFYKNMENIITAEKEKMLKDAEDVSIKLTEEKKKLEDANLDLVNNNNELVKAIGIEKAKKENNIKEKEKIENENKEIEDSIKALKIEKTNLEADKIEISAGVKTLLENQKNYSDTLQLEYRKLENKEVIKEVAEKKYDIQFTMSGDFDEHSIYKEDYKSSLGYYKNGKLEKEFSETETENLTYTVANAVYSIYHNSFNKVELNHNTETGKTFMAINYYVEENKISTDTIDFKPVKTDNFISLIKTKLTDFKNYIVEALEEKFNCRSNNKNIFNKENNQKNIDKKNSEIEY